MTERKQISVMTARNTPYANRMPSIILAGTVMTQKRILGLPHRPNWRSQCAFNIPGVRV